MQISIPWSAPSDPLRLGLWAELRTASSWRTRSWVYFRWLGPAPWHGTMARNHQDAVAVSGFHHDHLDVRLTADDGSVMSDVTMLWTIDRFSQFWIVVYTCRIILVQSLRMFEDTGDGGVFWFVQGQVCWPLPSFLGPKCLRFELGNDCKVNSWGIVDKDSLSKFSSTATLLFLWTIGRPYGIPDNLMKRLSWMLGGDSLK